MQCELCFETQLTMSRFHPAYWMRSHSLSFSFSYTLSHTRTQSRAGMLCDQVYSSVAAATGCWFVLISVLMRFSSLWTEKRFGSLVSSKTAATWFVLVETLAELSLLCGLQLFIHSVYSGLDADTKRGEWEDVYCMRVNSCFKFKSSQIYLYSSISLITNLPRGALKSVQHTTSSVLRSLHALK